MKCRAPTRVTTKRSIWFAIYIGTIHWAYAPSVVAQSWPGTETAEARELRILDALAPVIEMEQLGDSGNKLQGYRVQIFKDGRVNYQGWRDVKELGEKYSDISPEDVKKIQETFKEFGAWEAPSFDLYKMQLPFQTQLFRLRDGHSEKTLRFAGHRLGFALQKVVEDVVQTSRWRCPFMNRYGYESCAYRDSSLNDDANQFIQIDLPKLRDHKK